MLLVPLTVTTTGPDVAAAGTGVTIVCVPQLVGVALTPLNVAVLVPCGFPNNKPLIVTVPPTGAADGEIPEMMTPVVKATPLLARPPTVTITGPVVAPDGTGATMLEAPHDVGVAETPLNVTVLVFWVTPKFAPVIVTDVATGPELGVKVLIIGVGNTTVKLTPLLATLDTVTTTLPVVAPLGTGTAMLVELQLVGVAVVPLNVTVLVP